MTNIIVGVFFLALITLAIFSIRKLYKIRDDKKKSGNLPKATDNVKVVDFKGSGRKHDCGHLGPESFIVSFYGLRTDPVDDGKKCPDCFIEHVTSLIIRCCLCRLPILPGQPIALYAHVEGLQKEIATEYDGQWVGCLRWDCCPTGGAYAGHWTGEKIKTAFGGHSAAAETMRTGKPVAGSPQKGNVQTIETEDENDSGC